MGIDWAYEATINETCTHWSSSEDTWFGFRLWLGLGVAFGMSGTMVYYTWKSLRREQRLRRLREVPGTPEDQPEEQMADTEF
uniref:Transmembrane protein n=1 Tax=Steinernema glaseri TaxID=37863 RepID=A0A1I7ZXS3_9BILA